MDGPFYMRATNKENRQIILELIEAGRQGEKIIAKTLTSINEMKLALLKASNEVLNVIRVEGWSNKDINLLEQFVNVS
jgi:hypothetical protein